FGALTDVALGDLDPGLTVLYGCNGSGKSTLLQFVRGVFCGFEPSRRTGLLPVVGNQRGGGSLRILWEGDVCRFARHDEPVTGDRLRVTMLRSDLETSHPRFD